MYHGIVGHFSSSFTEIRVGELLQVLREGIVISFLQERVWGRKSEGHKSFFVELRVVFVDIYNGLN